MDEEEQNQNAEENAIAQESEKRFFVSQLVQHKYHGRGRVVGIEGQFYVMQFKNDIRKVPFSYKEMEAVTMDVDPEIERLRIAVREVLGDYGWIDVDLEMGKRWRGGVMRLVPGVEGTQAKDIPLEAFFKKIVSVREKLRVLEQKINNHPALEQEDRIELQGYITRCYGSLTTFNVLFADEASHFVGGSS